MDWSDSPDQAAFRAEGARCSTSGFPSATARPAATGPIALARSRGAPGGARLTDALAERSWFAPHGRRSTAAAASRSGRRRSCARRWRKRTRCRRRAGRRAVRPDDHPHGHRGAEARAPAADAERRTPDALRLSEPGAGSDLASLQTRAVRDGDEYVVNGQKIWTSNGHLADYLWVPVRTDPDAPKHRGISALLVPTNLPGVDFRPLINMGGEHGFNETFFENVRVPVRNRIGEENRGWYVGATALDFERSGIAGSATVRARRPRAGRLPRERRGRARSRVASSPALRREVADAAMPPTCTTPLPADRFDAGCGADPQLRGLDGQGSSAPS